MVVADLQGFRRGDFLNNKEEYILTDPTISCVESQFTSTDLGKFGIVKFFERHECNSHCNALKLKKNILLPNGIEITLPTRNKNGLSKETKIKVRVKVSNSRDTLSFTSVEPDYASLLKQGKFFL